MRYESVNQVRSLFLHHVKSSSEIKPADNCETYTPDQVHVAPGGKPVIFFTILALIDPGDEVVYPNPGFPIYESVINYIGAKAVPMPLVESRGFSFDLDEFEKKLSPKTKMVVLNSRIGTHINRLTPWADWNKSGTLAYRPAQYNAAQHWNYLRQAGIDPQRDLGYTEAPPASRIFLGEFNNSDE